MGVSVGLLVDCIWRHGSDLQAGVEIYYWEHPEKKKRKKSEMMNYAGKTSRD